DLFSNRALAKASWRELDNGGIGSLCEITRRPLVPIAGLSKFAPTNLFLFHVSMDCFLKAKRHTEYFVTLLCKLEYIGLIAPLAPQAKKLCVWPKEIISPIPGVAACRSNTIAAQRHLC